jgi:bla regulator protein BlaR1
MIDTGWFVDVALKSAAVAALALLAARALRGRSAAERSSVLHGGLVAMAALPLLVALAPRWQVPLPAMLAPSPALVVSVAADAGGDTDAMPVLARASAGIESPAPATPGMRDARSQAGSGARTAPDPSAPIAWRIDPAMVWGLLYALPALALLFTLGLSLAGLGALRERAVPLRDPRWDAALRGAQRRSGVRGRVELLHSTEAVSPLSWGMRRRVIVLDAAAIDPADADAMLAHELAHLARQDWIKLIFARIVTAVFWFNPFAWLLARRCHQLREEAADDAVLRGEVAGVDYAELLLRFARLGAAQPALAAHAIFSGRGAMRHLSQRLARALDERERRAPAPRAWSLGCAVAALALALPLAALTPAIAPAHAAPTPVAAARLATLSATPTANATATASPLTFTIGPRRTAQPGMVQVSFEERTARGHSSHSSGMPLIALDGLNEAALAADQPQAIAFRIVRAAGVLRCEGSARRGLATGSCDFAPDAAFAAELERRGVGRVTEREQLQLALQDARLELLDELARQGYAVPDVKRYVELSIHEVDVAWLRGLQSVGLKLDSLARLVEFRIHDVDAAYVGELKAAGYDALTPRQLVEFRIHGIDADGIVALTAAGIGDLPPQQLLAMHIHGASPEFAREMKSLGYGDVGADRLIEFRIHGVTPAFVRELATLGYRDLPTARLVEFRIHGVTPAFVRELATLGYRDLPTARLVEFRIHGVTPDFVRDVNGLGYRDVDPRDLVTMRIHGVTPAYIRAQLADAGGKPPSLEELVERRIHGD